PAATARIKDETVSAIPNRPPSKRIDKRPRNAFRIVLPNISSPRCTKEPEVSLSNALYRSRLVDVSPGRTVVPAWQSRRAFETSPHIVTRGWIALEWHASRRVEMGRAARIVWGLATEEVTGSRSNGIGGLLVMVIGTPRILNKSGAIPKHPVDHGRTHGDLFRIVPHRRVRHQHACERCDVFRSCKPALWLGRNSQPCACADQALTAGVQPRSRCIVGAAVDGVDIEGRDVSWQ